MQLPALARISFKDVQKYLAKQGKNPYQVEYPVESLSSSNEFSIFKLDFLGMTPVRHAVM